MKITEFEKSLYTCPHCGVKHTTPAALAHCILACEEKKEKEAEKKRVEELEKHKEVLKKEIEVKEAELLELKKSFFKDYGFYSSTRTYESNDEEFPYIWHWFFN